jgi:endonuclease/exonuclease/phosphatase (EEP) superfamily protein YafD
MNKIKLLQWNIWQSKMIGQIITVIKGLKPDIICLQELRDDMRSHNKVADFIENKLSMSSYCAVAQVCDEGKYAHSIGIFSRFPILDKNHYFLQKSRIKPLDATDEGRIYVETVLDVYGTMIIVGTTHLSYTNRFITTKKKRAEVDKFLEIIRHKKGKYLVAGDFNARPHSYVIKNLAHFLQHCGPGYQYNTWTTIPFDYSGFHETKLNWRLDYVFASKDIIVSSAEIIQASPSDHLPIMVEFRI